MAKLTFTQRYLSDTRFKQRADGLLMESIFAMAGIDAEGLCRRWEDGDRDLKLEDVAVSIPEPEPVALAAPEVEPVLAPEPEAKPAPKRRGRPPAKKPKTRRSTK